MATVSVILPTYNRLPLLRQAVESVFHQTYGDWECIVADDGSTDGTHDYLSELRDRRVRVVSLAHSGSPPKVRNAAIATACGEWIAFLDSDDLWHPSKLEVQLRSLAEHPHCGWGCADVGFIDAQSLPIPQRSGAPYRPLTGWILEGLIAATANVPTATLMVRRSLLEQVGRLDETLRCRDDLDISVRLAACGEICAIGDTLAFVRHHAGRTTSAERTSELYRQNEVIFRKAASSAQNNAIRRACKRRCAIELIGMGRALSREGRHGAALSASLRALRDDPFATQVWRAVLGCTLRAAKVRKTHR